jgi:hypothetical protein
MCYTMRLKTELLVHTELAQAQPATVILKLFKIAVRVVPYLRSRQASPAQQLPGQAPAA